MLLARLILDVLPAGQPFVQSSSVLLLSGRLRMHAEGICSTAGPTAAADTPSRRGLFRGRSQRTAAAATDAAPMTPGQHGTSSMRQHTAPALLIWGPEVLDTLEDRWVLNKKHTCLQ
jgi:hypothetical protein